LLTDGAINFHHLTGHYQGAQRPAAGTRGNGGEHMTGVRRVFPCHVPAYTARALLAREAVPTRVPGSL